MTSREKSGPFGYALPRDAEERAAHLAAQVGTLIGAVEVAIDRLTRLTRGHLSAEDVAHIAKDLDGATARARKAGDEYVAQRRALLAAREKGNT